MLGNSQSQTDNQPDSSRRRAAHQVSRTNGVPLSSQLPIEMLPMHMLSGSQGKVQQIASTNDVIAARPLLIQPRMPRVIAAADLVRSATAFDQLFPFADIVDFTGLSFQAQKEAVDKYMDLYHCRGQYAKSKDEEWRLRRGPDRRRKDYYWAALCGNDPDLTHKLLITADWNERMHQTNLLVVSNPHISNKFLTLTLTERNAIRFDALQVNGNGNANFLVLPEDILSTLTPTARKRMVKGISQIKFLACHDDGHSILGSAATGEPFLRATIAALFGQMPRQFRNRVVKQAVGCLSLLDQQDSFVGSLDRKEQNAFWHHAFVYVMQYLFEFRDPLLSSFIGKLNQQHEGVFMGIYEYPNRLRSAIWAQLDRDEPEKIHDKQQQQAGLEFMRKRVHAIDEVQSPSVRVNGFLPVKTEQGMIFMPPKVLKLGKMAAQTTSTDPIHRHTNRQTSTFSLDAAATNRTAQQAYNPHGFYHNGLFILLS